MPYFLKVHYQTGDSFGSETTTDLLEWDWKDYDIAVENANRIQEHYKMFTETSLYGESSYEKMEKKWGEKRWFRRSEEINFHSASNSAFSINLIDDNGNDFAYSTGMWCGYFEHRFEVEVVFISRPYDN